ncbi:MAG: heme A synthase [Acidobacteria bacterium]|nr:heme A synthase [Acidobacteriota bacterium]
MGRRAFSRYAWFFVAYLVAVIVYGAWVRVTGSGAGCGSHWPTCNGEILPTEPAAKTIIEFTHRITSGLCGVFGLVLVGWAFRLFGASSTVFRTAALTLVFIVFEALIGAGLVLGELVADNDSAARAIVIALHLTNTLLLTACAALTAWLAGDPQPPTARGQRPSPTLAAVGLLTLVLISVSGAVTALGDTLFPIEPTLGPGLLDKIRADLSSTNHFLVRLRVGHPLLAILGALLVASLLARPARQGAPWARAALTFLAVELGVGLWNVAWAAPGWLQLVHLLIAQALWVSALLAFAPSWMAGAAPAPHASRASSLTASRTA